MTTHNVKLINLPLPFAGTAKKRDVRTITASPSDLEPPNKTTGNNANVRNARVNNNTPREYLINELTREILIFYSTCCLKD